MTDGLRRAQGDQKMGGLGGQRPPRSFSKNLFVSGGRAPSHSGAPPLSALALTSHRASLLRPQAPLFLMLLVACTTAPRGSDDLGALAEVRLEGWEAFEGGALEDAKAQLGAKADAEPDPKAKAGWLFGEAEAAWVLGDFDEAARLHAQVARLDPAGPLTGWSLERLGDLSGLINDAQPTLTTALEGFEGALGQGPYDAQSDWARLHAAHLGLQLGLERWGKSDDLAPFDGSPWGVPTAWRVLGPASVHGLLDFGPITPLEQAPSLPERATLLGFERWTRLVHTDAPWLKFEVEQAGLYVAETWLWVEQDTTLTLAWEAQGPALLRLDGEELLRRDDRLKATPLQAKREAIKLGAGWHRITLQAAVSPGYKDTVSLAALPERGGTKLRFAASPDDGPRGRLLAHGQQRPWLPEDLDLDALGDDPQRLGLLAWEAIEVGDEGLAQRALERLRLLAPKHAWLGLLEAEAWRNRWSVPGSIRAREVLGALRRALEASPKAGRARLWLASELRQQGLKDEAQVELMGALGQLPQQSAVWVEAARYYQWRGLAPKAEEALEEALRLDPSDCGIIQMVYDARRERDFTAPLAQTPPAWRACEATDWRLARDVEQSKGDASRLLFHVKRDAARHPGRFSDWRAWVEEVRQQQGEAQALALLDEGAGRFEGEPGLPLLRVDLLTKLGRADEAREVLGRALARHPGDRELWRRAAALDARPPLVGELLLDARPIVAEYEAAPPLPNASAVYVLDYMVRRYFEDGSSVDLIHYIIQVRSKEGIDKYGEVAFPQGTTPLFLHTRKRDGRVLEPLPHKGKPTISLEALEPGDYVEYAYLDFHGPDPQGPKKWVGPQFYFEMADVASSRSEFLVEVPKAWPIAFASTGAAPSPEVTEGGAHRRYRFVKTRSEPPRAEPDGVAGIERLAHVQPLLDVTWEDALRGWQEVLASAQALTPSLRARAKQVVEEAGAKTEREKVRALYDYVVRQVRKPALRDFGTDASYVEATGSGNPAVLLQALLRVHGLNGRIFLAKPKHQPPKDLVVPRLDWYASTLLQVPLKGETLWLAPWGRWAPFGLIPESVQGVPALCIEPGASAERVLTPTMDPGLEVRELELDLRLDGSGNLTGVMTETLRGFGGMSRRAQYEELGTQDQLTRFVERQLNYDISGAQVLGWSVEGRDDPLAPLVLRVELRRDGYARLDPKVGLVIEDRHDLPDLTRRYGALPERTIPMLLPFRRQKVTLKLRGPEGRAPRLSGEGDRAYSSPFGSYERRASVADGALTVTHSLFIPLQRVAPSEYAELVGWAGDVDRATYIRIEVP